MSFVTMHCSISYLVYLVVHVLFTTCLLDWMSCLSTLLNMCLWATCLLRKVISDTIVHQENVLLVQMSCSSSLFPFFTLLSFARKLPASILMLLLVPSTRIEKKCLNHHSCKYTTHCKKVPSPVCTCLIFYLQLLVLPIAHYSRILIFLSLFEKVRVRLLLNFFFTLSPMISSLHFTNLFFLCPLFLFLGILGSCVGTCLAAGFG